MTYPGKSWIVPESENDLIKYLDERKPVYTCVYFHAAWNPMCKRVEKDYDNFAANNTTFDHIKIDCDELPRLKLFFDARIEPQFLMLLNGSEVHR